MKPKYFDAHSHLNFEQFDEDREKVVDRMKDKGIWTITVGTDRQTSYEAVDLADKHEHIFATVGVHPADYKESFDSSYYEELAKHPKVVGIGECGFDYFRGGTRKEQEPVFLAQIEFAKKCKLPLMLHCRPSKGSMDAYENVLDLLTTHDVPRTTNQTGNVHFFVGSVDVARRFLDLGFTISFDGPITFTHEYDEVVRYIPIDMILAETDAPFAAPDPYRSKRNEPSYVREVVKAIAKIRGEDEGKVREYTIANTTRVFSIPGGGTM